MSKSMLEVSLQETTGPINDLFKKLDSKEGRTWLTAFKQFLRRENPWTPEMSVSEHLERPALLDRTCRQMAVWSEELTNDQLALALHNPRARNYFLDCMRKIANECVSVQSIEERPAWKTLQLGVYKTSNELLAAISVYGELEEKVRLAIQLIEPITTPSSIDLVLVTVGELCSSPAKDHKIFHAAAQHGLIFVPAEVGPLLWLDLHGQAVPKNIYVAMKSLRPAPYSPFRFLINTRSWLSGSMELANYTSDMHCQFVFCRPRPSVQGDLL